MLWKAVEQAKQNSLTNNFTAGRKEGGGGGEIGHNKGWRGGSDIKGTWVHL